MKAVALLLAAICLAAAPVKAEDAAPVNHVPAPIGIVLMHGKKGVPQFLSGAKAELERAGYLVVTPEMCWSMRRQYDHTRPECLAEIDAAAAQLRTRGARSVVIAGHSLGGSAAIAYGAGRTDVAGVAALAAGDAFWGEPSRFPEIGRAWALAGTGHGQALTVFQDIQTGGSTAMRTTPEHFLSFVAPGEAELMPAKAAALRAPLLMVVGNRDPMTMAYDQRVFARAPASPDNRFIRIDADHLGTARAAAKPLIAWLETLAK